MYEHCESAHQLSEKHVFKINIEVAIGYLSIGQRRPFMRLVAPLLACFLLRLAIRLSTISNVYCTYIAAYCTKARELVEHDSTTVISTDSKVPSNHFFAANCATL